VSLNFILEPWQFFFAILAGWVNREQQQVIDYLRTENQVLKETYGKKRILLTTISGGDWPSKARSSAASGWRKLARCSRPTRSCVGIDARRAEVEPHRQAEAGWASSDVTRSCQACAPHGEGKPDPGLRSHPRSVGQPGHEISDQTVATSSRNTASNPRPNGNAKTTWATFIKAHWDVLAAIDFTTIEVWTKGGLVTFYLLLVMELKSRCVHFAGCTPNPNEVWMKQIAKKPDRHRGRLPQGKRYVLMDRDGAFCPAFREILKNEAPNPCFFRPRVRT